MMHKGKIAELYKQAHREHQQEYFSSVVDPTVKSVSVTRYFDHELFAQLIVEECIDIVAAGGEFASRPKLVEKLQEHFGVEE
jgi:2,4-dienoyl-CoA reductase-like NADH-dependent reductase (Old Yellow Enzyme family)